MQNQGFSVDLAPESLSGLNAAGFFFTLIAVGLLFVLPRRLVLLPFLMAAFYVPRSQSLELGPITLPLIRILIPAGFVRVMMKGESIIGGFKLLDRLMVFWAVWMMCSGMFHASGVLTTRFGEVCTDLGIYFLCRILIRGLEDIETISRLICILLVPVAAGMLLEKLTGRDTWAQFWGESSAVMMRNGHFRARGPFVHPILAGTVGAVCLPMAFYFWRKHRKTALTGFVAGGAIIYACGSSGPIMTAASIFGALALWRVRSRLRPIRWLTLFLIVALDIVMKDPVYYLIARLDVSSGSTGWYRAFFIHSAIEHLSEWWLVGTDFTRGWLPRYLGGSDTSADITNHYIQMGVWGGLPLMFLFVGILLAAFSAIGKLLVRRRNDPFREQFLIWTLGSVLFGHAVTFLSVSYFDPPIVFLFYFLLGAIGSTYAAIRIDEPVSRCNATPGSDVLPEPQAFHG